MNRTDKYKNFKDTAQIAESAWLGFMLGGFLGAVAVANSWLWLGVLIGIIAVGLAGAMTYWRAIIKGMEIEMEIETDPWD